MSTMLMALQNASADATVLVVQDAQGKIFGGLASHRWKVQPGFFGNGECFVFDCTPTSTAIAIYPWYVNTCNSNDIHVYWWIYLGRLADQDIFYFVNLALLGLGQSYGLMVALMA